MNRYSKITPEGTKDLLFGECVQREQLLEKLTGMFRQRGYREVMTPAIEFYDVFGSSAAHFPQEDMYKLSDLHGRLMVLRPDCTIPIARLTATRLTGMPAPLRLFYSQNVYRVAHDMRGKSNEFFQTGVELIGAGSLRGDLEMVELAASCLGETGGEAYRLELCNIGYFKALIESLCTDDETKEEIRQKIEQKNYPALGDLLNRFGEGNRAAAALKYLPRLFGGGEVFEKAYALFSQNGAKESLDYLRTIYENLCSLGLQNRVLIDLSLVNQAEYYTGIVFRGYFDGVGEQVLSGGRYDNLIGEFGAPMPAIGFGFNVDLAAQTMETIPAKPADILVFADEEHLSQAINYMKTLHQEGLTAESSVFDDYDAAAEYARRCGIRQLHVVGEEIEVVEMRQGGRRQ